MFEMKDEYLVGIEMIDEEHRKLFEIAERTYQLLHNDYLSDKYDNISDILQELKDYTIEHFRHEEEYMEKIQYKRMFTQKMQHRAFIQKLEEYSSWNLDRSQDDVIQDIFKFLTDWLTKHIYESDKLIGEAEEKEED
ncbi:bacteriohemerythrin [bacterium 1XD42-8]|jgi:hemerythrin|nr:hemerythrin family protein [Lachnospiraceae bacterium]RKJ45037.1 bacteriohemerythrin [bacterium 1XD42-8]